jgi:putative SOS response-associated peptidase YedK
MCRFYSDSQPEKNIGIGQDRFHFTTPARYVIRTTNQATVICRTDEGLAHGDMRWGFEIPKLGAVVNARCETVAEKHMFRGAFRSRRCLVPACGFFESTAGAGGRRLPVRFIPTKGGHLLLAGLWSLFPDVGNCFTIITTTPNKTVAQYHDRMPVILDAAGADFWLRADWGDLARVMVPAPDNLLDGYLVTPMVFKPGFNDPEALKPVPAQANLL